MASSNVYWDARQLQAKREKLEAERQAISRHIQNAAFKPIGVPTRNGREITLSRLNQT
jgi:hypothetical protein